MPKRSTVAASLADPRFRKRVTRNRKTYTRKIKHNGEKA
jgi:stalled ribosome alternative rescue factor ArfA